MVKIDSVLESAFQMYQLVYSSAVSLLIMHEDDQNRLEIYHVVAIMQIPQMYYLIYNEQ